MKGIIEYTTLHAVLVAALLGSGCSGFESMTAPTTPSAGASTEVAPVGTTWAVTSVDGVAAGVVLSSDLTFESEQRVAGNSGCNRYVAQLNQEPLVRIGEPVVTRMMCDPPLMDQEHRFLNALNFTTRYRVDGDQMFFHDRSGRVLIRFMRRLPGPGAPR